MALLLLSIFCHACQADSGSSAPAAQPWSPVSVKQGNFQILPETRASLAGHELNIMLARTFDEKALGLMFYEKLEENRGMLFLDLASRDNSPRSVPRKSGLRVGGCSSLSKSFYSLVK